MTPGQHKENYIQRSHHSTEKELVFLENIGKHRSRVLNLTPEQSRMYRLACLKGYKEAALKREDWVMLDKKVILAFVNKMMEELK